ncbi:PREDICTED: putative aspartate aminotransferase, cytoplasmic 2 [Galeopterus variegatus]|uniref:Aspartate aminotransferase, cytoplasmic 2 n=1 Tax=Galeopterus variegatus TaxID=482537 RepID=A0ABM0SC11_GALVR|nr:PREDICTED: putative aspartate aminotransferase, cytoplasmic 2 [Galeopterus variegatus]
MPTLSVFVDVPLARKLEGSLLKTYKRDNFPNKAFLAYRVCMTSEGQPWVSLVVCKTRLLVAQDPSLNYEYLPTMGMKSFIQASLELLFGKHSQAIVENRVGGVHTVGDSGAVQIGVQFLKAWHKDAQVVYIISSQKEMHGLIFQDMGFTVYEYCIWDPKRLCMDSKMFLDVVQVEGPRSELLPRPHLQSCFLSSPPPNLQEVVENIMLIKEKVKEKLRLLGTPGSWDHITEQSGTHGYLGLNFQQVEYLVKKKHIYIPQNGRINFSCINANNIDYITQSINEAVLATKGSE